MDKDPLAEFEIFKIGRMKVIFPSDIREDELQFMAMMMYSYIHTAKFKSINPLWPIRERLEKAKEKASDGAGVS